MRRLVLSLLITSFIAAGTTRCVGSFALTRTWDRFINNLGNKWINAVAFFLAVYFQFYLVVLLVDMILLNSMEFWGGENPVKFDEKGEHRKSMTKGDERVEFTYRKFGGEMEIRAYKRERPAGRLLLKKNRKGVFHVRDGKGWVAMTIRSEEKDGFKLLHLLAGNRRIHSRAYTAAEYHRLRTRAREADHRPAYAASPAPTRSF